MDARIWTYPWDVLDDGLGVSLSRIAQAGCNEISLAVSYHGAMLLLPHNPRRKVCFLEDGVVYFRPDERFYQGTPVRPVPSELTAQSDPLAVICEAAASQGLGTVAWTVTLHNSRLGLRFPEFTVENAFGDRYPYALCPAQPPIRQYVCGMVSDLSTRYPLAAVEIEALQFMRYPHAWTHAKEGVPRTGLIDTLLSLCFCPACTAAASRHVDAAGLRDRVRSALEAAFMSSTPDGGSSDPKSPAEVDALVPGYAAYTASRLETVTSLLREIRAATQAPLSAIIGTGVPERPWLVGVDLAAFAAACDTLVFTCYRPEATEVEQDARFARAHSNGSRLYAGLQSIWPLARGAGDLAAKVSAVKRAGADGVSLYNYGLMPLPNLGWVKEALAVCSHE
jgi:hypothetical protein